MRLWTLHPKYLDAQGLVALWREALLAKAVLGGETRGYTKHPQLIRFKQHLRPRSAINSYLSAVHIEATERGYSFDRSKIGPVRAVTPITATRGQIAYEWQHLMGKLSLRSPELYQRWRPTDVYECHPMFKIRDGGVETWERPKI